MAETAGECIFVRIHWWRHIQLLWSFFWMPWEVVGLLRCSVLLEQVGTIRTRWGCSPSAGGINIQWMLIPRSDRWSSWMACHGWLRRLRHYSTGFDKAAAQCATGTKQRRQMITTFVFTVAVTLWEKDVGESTAAKEWLKSSLIMALAKV